MGSDIAIFQKLKANQLIEGINLSIQNSQSLFEMANLSRSNGNFGLAKSLFILSCEESIKAFALYNYFTFDDNRDISLIFKNHTEKLTILKEGYHLMKSDTKAMKKAFDQALTDFPNEEDIIVEKRAKEYYQEYYLEILNQTDNETIKADRDWWNNANKNKQKGFYVGFEGGVWQDPLKAIEKEATEAGEKALFVLSHVQAYKDADEREYKSRK